MATLEAVEPHPPVLVFKCRRCDQCVTEAHDDCAVAIRRLIESGSPFVVHTCERQGLGGGGLGLCDLIGATAPGWYPGKPYWTETAA